MFKLWSFIFDLPRNPRRTRIFAARISCPNFAAMFWPSGIMRRTAMVAGLGWRLGPLVGWVYIVSKKVDKKYQNMTKTRVHHHVSSGFPRTMVDISRHSSPENFRCLAMAWSTSSHDPAETVWNHFHVVLSGHSSTAFVEVLCSTSDIEGDSFQSRDHWKNERQGFAFCDEELRWWNWLKTRGPIGQVWWILLSALDLHFSGLGWWTATRCCFAFYRTDWPNIL